MRADGSLGVSMSSLRGCAEDIHETKHKKRQENSNKCRAVDVYLIYSENIRLNGSGVISSALKFSSKITLNYSPSSLQASLQFSTLRTPSGQIHKYMAGLGQCSLCCR